MKAMTERKLEFRLWPYTQYQHHREYYLSTSLMPDLEGLYFDYMKHKWMPQNENYDKKAKEFQKKFDENMKIIEHLHFTL